MFKIAVILALAVAAHSQVLRISPVVIGSTQPGAQQTIVLSGGGSLGSGPRRSPGGGGGGLPKPLGGGLGRGLGGGLGGGRPRPLGGGLGAGAGLPRPSSNSAWSNAALVASAASLNEKPEPFAFAFDSVDEYGTKISRQESGDQRGAVTGSYTLSDANGISRTVNYVADDSGFRAEVKTNEPGTLTSNPADVKIQSSASRR